MSNESQEQLLLNSTLNTNLTSVQVVSMPNHQNSEFIRWLMVYTIEVSHIVVASFGILSNIVILLIFHTHGLVSTSNISFFSLALTDLYVCVYWTIRQINIKRPNCGDVCWEMDMYMHQYIVDSVSSMNSLGAWIIAVITMERLCCVAFPMKVKLLITPKLVTCLILGYLAVQTIACMMFGFSYMSYLQLRYDPASYLPNTTDRTMTPSAQQKHDILLHVVFDTRLIAFNCSTFVLFGIILVGTILLIITFKRSVNERISLMGDRKIKKASTPAKETRLIKSVIAVCVIYILLSGNRHWFDAMWLSHNLNLIPLYVQHALDLIFHLLDICNHSINIFVYFYMNSEFRKSFIKLFCFKCKSRL